MEKVMLGARTSPSALSALAPIFVKVLSLLRREADEDVRAPSIRRPRFRCQSTFGSRPSGRMVAAE